MQKAKFALGWHDQEAVGLGDGTGHLGQELGAGDADADRQINSIAHLVAQTHGDLGGCAGDASQAADIEERLVDRDALDERRGVVEHVEHRLARFGIGSEPRFDENQVGTQPPGLTAAHRTTHASGSGLVAGAHHHADTDGDRAPA